MRLPYALDNRAHTLADVLNDLLGADTVNALDVATAYFNFGGFDLLRESREQLASFTASSPGKALATSNPPTFQPLS